MDQRILLVDGKKGGYLYGEALKTLRTNLQFCGAQIRAVLLTSCFPDEGKSDIAFHLAVELGRAGKRVLLLDADIRKSVYLTRYMVSAEVNGLSQFLSGQIKSLEQIVYHTNYDNMDIIFSGPPAPNPSELLGQKLFRDMMAVLKKQYDYILVDTPPMGSLIDAAVAGQSCDGALLVVESGKASYKAEQKIKAQLEKSGCHVLGAVLNKVDIQQDRYYSSYYKNYGSYEDDQEHT